MTLKDIRIKRGLTLRQLAQLSGTGASTIGNYENGKTTISEERLKRIAQVLEVPLGTIREPISSVYEGVERKRGQGGWRMETQVIEEVRARIEQLPFASPEAREVYLEQIKHRLEEYVRWCDGHYSEVREELVERARASTPASTPMESV